MEKSMNLTEQCQLIAREVFNTLGSGYDEKIYQKAFEAELRLLNIRYENTKIVPVTYKGFNVGEGIIDLIVYSDKDSIILELKAIASTLSGKEETQLMGYMKTLQVQTGLLINFQQAGRKETPDEPEFRQLLLNQSVCYE